MTRRLAIGSIVAALGCTFGAELLHATTDTGANQMAAHEWRPMTTGSLIAAGLAIDRALLKDDIERFSIVVGCSVATPIPTLTAALITTNIGVDVRQPVVMDVDGVARQVPVSRSGLTPQHATIAPGLVPSLTKSLSQATNVHLTFTDAFGQQRDWMIPVANGSALAAMLAPCSL